jgi:hypothetical protein
MSKGPKRQITHLEVELKKSGEMIVLDHLGVFSQGNQVIEAKTREEVTALYPQVNITFIQLAFDEPLLPFGNVPAEEKDED